MYIVHEGLVAVVGGAEDNEVLAELGPGSIFGEIRWRMYAHTHMRAHICVCMYIIYGTCHGT